MPDADGTGGQITYPNFTRTDAALSTHWKDSVAVNNALAAINNRKYHYDQAGRIDQIMLGTEPKQIAFGYDALGRLNAREYRGSCSFVNRDPASGQSYNCPNLLSSQYFSYDAMGNREDNGGAVTTGNRYVTLNGATYSYDADGNVTEKSKPGVYNRRWYWNAAGQLDSAVTDGQRVQFEYDAFGRPVRVKEGTSYPLTLQRYLLWDGAALLAQLNPAGQRGVDYAYLPGTIDQPFAYTGGVTTPKTPHFVEQDEVGNVISSSRDGLLTQEVTYDGWGSHSASNNNQALFWKGLYWNGESTGLYYMRNRWYDPEAGRFVSEDPAGFAGGINLYAFAGNDPVNGRDPSGLSSQCHYVSGDYYEPMDPRPGDTMGGVRVVHYGFWVCVQDDASGGGGGSGFGDMGWEDGGGGDWAGGDGGHAAPRDATGVASREDQRAVAERLRCQIFTGLATNAALGGVSAAVGGISGAVQYGTVWANRGGFFGGVLAGTLGGPGAAAAGYYGGRIIGMTMGTLYGARAGLRVTTFGRAAISGGVAAAKCGA